MTTSATAPACGANGTRTLTQTFNAANQVDGASYDEAGNLTDDGSVTYGYDALNRMTLRSTYNGDGALIDDGTTRYTQDLDAPLTQVLNSPAPPTPTPTTTRAIVPVCTRRFGLDSNADPGF